MGFIFELKHANIVAYLTDPGDGNAPPRLRVQDVIDFLGGIADDGEALITEREKWSASIRGWADQKRAALQAQYKDRTHERLGEQETRDTLQELRKEFQGFPFCALAVREEEDAELRSFMIDAARKSEGRGLYLIPREKAYRVEMFDPFPQMSRLADHPESWPGVLFWSGAESAFVSMRDAKRLNREMLEAAGESDFVVQTVLKAHRHTPSAVRLLHLSDLHFGSTYAQEKRGYLKGQLATESFDRVLITGDLFDNPRRRDALDFRDFRDDLQRSSKKPVSVVPGNHDQKILGNSISRLGIELRQAADLEWSSVVIDDSARLVLFCFNSGIDAGFANGRVTVEQLTDVAIEFEKQCHLKPQVESYLRVALVHHHPFSWDAKAETFIQKTLRVIGLADERFLAMKDSKRFVDWCGARKIPLILHGHKHLQRHVQKPAADRVVDAIGCGTSLGAEGLPLTYNILAWDPNTQRWGVTFYEDVDSYGFKPRKLAIDKV